MRKPNDLKAGFPAGSAATAAGQALGPENTGGNHDDRQHTASPAHSGDIVGRPGLSGLGERVLASQPERLIRSGRLISSSFAFLAIYLDPTQPARNVTETYAVLAVYLAYSAYLVVAPSRRPLNDRAHCFTHAIDIIVLGVLAFLSGELSSPFFSFFTFALITAAIRWGLSGAIITALILDALLVALGWPYIDSSRSDLNILIMRSAYALVFAALLGYFASSRERSRRRLFQLASWPAKAAGEDTEPWLASSLSHASAVLGGVRLLVLWVEREEPSGGLIWSDGARCQLRAAPAESCHEMIDAGSQEAGFQYDGYGGGQRLPAALRLLLPPNFLDSPPKRDRARPNLCSAPFASPHYRGRLFVLEPGSPNDDILSLTEIVAARIASELEQLAMMRELAAAASWQERGRLARDLHDSVLQDLTAASLQLKAASLRPADTMRTTLDTVSSLLTEQQRRIRRFVESARPSPASAPAVALDEQLQLFAQALGRQWQCAVRVTVDPGDLTVPSRLAAEICQLVAEGTANAVRHGRARQLDVSVQLRNSGLDLVMVDDGEGLAPPTAIDETHPQSIRERVHELGGHVRVQDGADGFHISIRLPL